MTPIQITAFELGQRYVGIAELGAREDHPLIQWWLSLCALGLNAPDETPWCSAYVNGIAWELRLPRSKSARARSWLLVGEPIALEAARPGFDVVVFNRGGDPSPEVIQSPGHVGFFAALEGDQVLVLGGNQGNAVSLARFPRAQVLGVRRLRPGGA